MEKQAKKLMKGAKANWNKAKRTYVCRSLKDLIKAYRACTTAAEERALVKIEAAQIRDLFREGDKHFRRQNIAKLLFFHMNGYPTDFGITECVKLCASNKFSDKRVAYLGITILVNEGDQVLMLVTNSLKQDLVSHDPLIVALALNVLGDIASAEMVRDLMPEIEKLLQSPNPALRKKAGLAAIRAVRKLDAEECSNILDLVPNYFDIKSPAVHLSGSALVQALCRQDRQNVTIMQQTVLPILLRLISDTTVPSTIQVKGNRPGGKGTTFLQIKLLSAVRSLVETSMPEEVTREISEMLKKIASRDEPGKVDGCAVLYECVRVAVLIKSDVELLTTSVKILGKFLTHKEATIRYIALQELTGLVDAHSASILSSISDHKKNILARLHEVDPTVRRQAVELICQITNSENVEEMVKELLDYIQSAETKTAVKDGCEKVFYLADKFGTSPGWKIETFITTLKLGDNALSENLLLHLVNMIAVHPELQAQAIRQFHDGILKEDKPSSDNGTSSKKKPISEGIGIYILGEHAASASDAGLSQDQILCVLKRLLHKSNDREDEWLSTGRVSLNNENKALGEVAVSAAAKFASRSECRNVTTGGLTDIFSSITGEKRLALPAPGAQMENTSNLEADVFDALALKPTASSALVVSDGNLLSEAGNSSTSSMAVVPAHQQGSGVDLLDEMLGEAGERHGSVQAKGTNGSQSAVVNDISHLLSNASCSPDVEKQQRACEYLAMLNAGLTSTTSEPLGQVPPMQSHQLKIGSKPTRTRTALGQGGTAFATTGLLLDLMDDDSGKPVDAPALLTGPLGNKSEQPLQPSSSEPAGGDGLTNLDDILSLASTSNGGSLSAHRDALSVLSTLPGPSKVSNKNDTQYSNLNIEGLAFDEDIKAREEAELTTSIVESDAVCVEASFFRDTEDRSSMRVEIVIGNKSNEHVSDACLQLAVPKYMQLNMQPASSSEIEVGSRITQTVNISNKMQGEKPVQLRYRMEFRCGDVEDVTRLEGVVSNLESL